MAAGHCRPGDDARKPAFSPVRNFDSGDRSQTGAESTSQMGTVSRRLCSPTRRAVANNRNLSSGFQDDLDAVVLLVAEHLVRPRRVVEAGAVGDRRTTGRSRRARCGRAAACMYRCTCVCPILHASAPLLNAAPNGILSRNPPYTPGIDTVPPLRQQWIAWRSAPSRSVASIAAVFTLS